MLCLTTLPTLDGLAEFWQSNRQQYHFAAFNEQCEWIFGDRKHEVMKALLRWDQNQTFVFVREDRRDWYLVNAQGGLTKWDLVGHLSTAVDLSAPIDTITHQVLDVSFDHWFESEQCRDLFDQKRLEEYIAFSRDEQAAGRDYYGSEYEARYGNWAPPLLQA